MSVNRKYLNAQTSLVALFTAAGLFAAGCSSSGQTSGGDGSNSNGVIKVGVITSTTGDLASIGQAEVNGFMAGLNYVTGGTNKIDGHEVSVTVQNDNDSPVTGLAEAKALLGQGVKFIVGPVDSAIGLAIAPVVVQDGGTYVSGPSGSYEFLGLSKSVFLTTGGGWMNNGAILALAHPGQTIAYVDRDVAEGQSAYQALAAAGKADHITVQADLFPADTQDFLPYVTKMMSTKPDLIAFSWVGNGVNQLYAALAQANAFSTTPIVALLGLQAQYPALAATAGPANAVKMTLLPLYYPGFGGDNKAEQAMIAYANRTKQPVQYDTPGGFMAAQMLARSVNIAGSGLDQAKVSEALTGWTFSSPQEQVTIRSQDHMLMVPMYVAKLVHQNGSWVPELVRTLPAAQIAPPVSKSITS